MLKRIANRVGRAIGSLAVSVGCRSPRKRGGRAPRPRAEAVVTTRANARRPPDVSGTSGQTEVQPPPPADSSALGNVWRLLESAVREDPPPGPAAWARAHEIARAIRESRVRPIRIGIDGLPGSGKSSLARALAAVLEMGWRSLDYENVGSTALLGDEGMVFEHHRLLRTQDVELLDLIVYIDEPVEVSWARVVERGRGAVLGLMLDYRRMKEIGKAAFDLCRGRPIVLSGGDLLLKFRPLGGYRLRENLDTRLAARGLEDGGRTTEEMLFVLVCGRRRYGLAAYLLHPVRIARRLRRLLGRARKPPDRS